MAKKKLDKLIEQMENYLECWKQFNHFINLARAKKIRQEDEDRFLEVKSIIIQELEFVLANMDVGATTRDEVHALINGAPSLRFIGEMQEAALRNLETQWHKIYIGWHSVLGQIKVQQREDQAKSFFASLGRSEKGK